MMKVPNYKIIEGDSTWEDRYIDFCQGAYEKAYTNLELNITPDLHNEEVFATPHFQQYFRGLFTGKYASKIWLVIDQNENIIGSVAVQDYGNHCEMKAFYVKPDLKGKGIGRELYEKVLDYVGDRSIEVEVIHYHQDAINMYLKWGYEIDEQRGKIIYNRSNWPELAAKNLWAIVLVKK